MFISYARADAAVVANLRTDLEEMIGPTWIDSRIGGGQEWWGLVLGAIRQCDLFVFAVSPASLASEACRSELDYADALARPILPVLVDDVDLRALPTKLHEIQVVTYEPFSPDGIRSLAKALLGRRSAPPLPTSLPQEPPVPRSYGEEYRLRLAVPSMSMDDQVGLAAILKGQCGDPIHGDDAKELLVMLRGRPDIVMSVANDIDAYLAAVPLMPPVTARTDAVPPVRPGAGTAAAHGQGSLRVQRNDAWGGRAIGFMVSVDGRELGVLKPTQHLDVDLDSGSHEFVIAPLGLFGKQYATKSGTVEISVGQRVVVTFSNNKLIGVEIG